MKEQSRSTFSELSTPLVADAALRRKIAFRIAPPGIKPVVPGTRIAGDALPAQHFGSVDVFLEAMQHSQPGNVLVIDNGGRMDEGCIGDLTALEAQVSGLAGIVVWAYIAILPSFDRSDFPFSVTARGPLARSASTRATNQRSGMPASAISRCKQVMSFSQMTTAAFSSARKMSKSCL